MTMKFTKRTAITMIAVLAGAMPLFAAKNKQPPPAELTGKGKALQDAYAKQLQGVRAVITRAIPELDEQKKAAYLTARDEEKAADTAVAAAQKNLHQVRSAEGLVGHAKGKWIGGAERGIAAATEKLKAAKTDEEREAAKKELANWEKNKQDGLDALKERQAKLDAAKAQEPQWLKDLEAAKAAQAQAQANTMKAHKALGLQQFMKSDKLDSAFARFFVLSHATPNGLAAYAEKGKDEEALITQLLSDPDLMLQMAVAYGAKGGKYGEAMGIYNAIQKASKKAKDGLFQRLALGIALEHAVPVSQRNPKANSDAPATVDPVKRYLHYEKAYCDGELDEGFKGLSTWDYRMVVNGNEPDETLAWGREMLRNYRPDHIATPDTRWRYVQSVRTDVRYGSQFNQYDKPELQFFQNIIMNGGVCGRRAFFGRYILRAFGVPTTARPQRGHAALVHWTPEGWAVCLGGGWGAGWVGASRGGDGRKPDKDFLAVTQARENPQAYMEVLRAQWVGDVLGEAKAWGFLSGAEGFWNIIGLDRQRGIIDEANAVALAAVGTDIGEANESKTAEALKEVTLTDADRTINIAKNGTITIPATACSRPTASTAKIKFMDSPLGGKQIHYGRTGEAEDWEYQFDAPKSGKYKLSARVVTVSPDQVLVVSSSGAKESADPVNVALPFTIGMWGDTKPVEIMLAKGKNILTCSRTGDNIRGLTIKDFTLTPVK